MVLAREQGGAADAVVHDAATGQALPVGGGPLGLIHAWGNKIVYARPVGGVETVHVAELREEKTGAKE